MVSNAREDFPEPDRPVNTIMASRGRSRSTLRRLCSRAPLTTRRVMSGRFRTGRDGPASRTASGSTAEWTSTAGSSATALGTTLMLIENFFEKLFRAPRAARDVLLAVVGGGQQLHGLGETGALGFGGRGELGGGGGQRTPDGIAGTHNGPVAALRHYDAGGLEFLVGPRHGVGGHAQFAGEAPHGRKPGARCERAVVGAFNDVEPELFKERDGAGRIGPPGTGETLPRGVRGAHCSTSGTAGTCSRPANCASYKSLYSPRLPISC